MITDPATLQDIRDSWGTVRYLHAMIETNLAIPRFMGGMQDLQFGSVVTSLTALFAFSVLEDTLKALKDQGIFNAKQSKLGHLMKASQPAIPWVDFDRMVRFRDARNDVAHKRCVLTEAATLRILDAIETELIAWKVLDGPVRRDYMIERKPTS